MPKKKPKKQPAKKRAAKRRTYTLTRAAIEQRRQAGAAGSPEAKAEAGSIGGSVSSAPKRRAVRENAKLGGRPGNPEIRRIMEERGVSRQRAHQILRDGKK